jgi:hypothetical protein
VIDRRHSIQTSLTTLAATQVLSLGVAKPAVAVAFDAPLPGLPLERFPFKWKTL